MDSKNHFFLTFLALFSLGFILAKPGSGISETRLQRDCKLSKGRMDCSLKHQEYEMNGLRDDVKVFYTID